MFYRAGIIERWGMGTLNIIDWCAENGNPKSYAVSHHAANLDEFPLHIVGFNDSLDRKREEGGSRMSPHALLQEHVNLTENLYALVTNGLHLRLLRNSSRLTGSPLSSLTWKP